MTVIRHDTVSGAAITDEHKPRIGYANFFREGTVSCSSEQTDHPKELAYDGFTYDAWRSDGGPTQWLAVQVAASPGNYFAVGAHTLAGCDVTPQRSDDGSSWTDIESAYTVPDNRPIVWENAEQTRAYWRLLITNAPDVVSIGAIHVGLDLMLDRGLPVGFAPPDLNENIVYSNPISEGGQLLGRHLVRRGAMAQVTTDKASYTWAREDWDAFIQVAHQYPVFFWWSHLGKAEIVYGGVDQPKASFVSDALVSASFRISGINR